MNSDLIGPLAHIVPMSPIDQARHLESTRRALVPVRFVKDCQTPSGPLFGGGYNEGEVAGFPEHVAAELKRLGLAVDIDGAMPKATATPALSVYVSGAVTPAAVQTVEFIREYDRYVVGDKAGVSPDVARMLITKGIARGLELNAITRSLKSVRDALFRR